MTENKEKPNFWTTLPGVLTGLATVITAIGGIYLGANKFEAPKTQTASMAPGSKQETTASDYPDISGAWKLDNGSGQALIKQSGRTFSITAPDGRNASEGSFLDKSNLKAFFPGDPGCCNGELKGNQIFWSNGTVWFRQ